MHFESPKAHGSIGAVDCAKLVASVREVTGDRVLAQHQLFRDLPVGEPVSRKIEDLDLPRTQTNAPGTTLSQSSRRPSDLVLLTTQRR